jgi:hypothetical protein
MFLSSSFFYKIRINLVSRVRYEIPYEIHVCKTGNVAYVYIIQIHMYMYVEYISNGSIKS